MEADQKIWKRMALIIAGLLVAALLCWWVYFLLSGALWMVGIL